MSEKILVPVLGESITEATVSKWLKNKGDSVKVDEPIVELETDKVNLEVPSPIDGVLSEINSENGSTVGIGALLGSISQNSDFTSEKNEPEKVENNVVSLEIERREPKIFDEKLTLDVPAEKPLILTQEIEKEDFNLKKNNKETLSPAVRKIVVENKIDLQKVRGSGKEGRILKGDLISIMGVTLNHQKKKLNMVKKKELK